MKNGIITKVDDRLFEVPVYFIACDPVEGILVRFQWGSLWTRKKVVRVY